ncbi:putative toxin-antitoxin system toxin component, PIN family [Candidatus Poribacteria bacterium]|nr:MAG: putative toxin-antitoxin system toxin component, PIN family [Candidatus Poribacteria bacterium]
MHPVAVYDTNVLISGMIWGGVPYDCLRLAQGNKVAGLTCDEILDEFFEKLTAKFNFPVPQTEKIVEDLLRFLQRVEIPGELKGAAPDADDDMVLECAVVGGATHIVTGNMKHLLPIRSYQGILIVTPADFLAQFRY